MTRRTWSGAASALLPSLPLRGGPLRYANGYANEATPLTSQQLSVTAVPPVPVPGAGAGAPGFRPQACVSLSANFWKAGYFYAALGIVHLAIWCVGVELVKEAAGSASPTSLAANFQAVLLNAREQPHMTPVRLSSHAAAFIGFSMLMVIALGRVLINQLLLGRLFPLIKPAFGTVSMPLLRCAFNTLLALWSLCEVLQLVMPHAKLNMPMSQACASEAIFGQLGLLLLGLAHGLMLLCLRHDREASGLFVVITAAVLIVGLVHDLLLAFDLSNFLRGIGWVQILHRSVLMTCLGLAMPRCLHLRSVAKLAVCRLDALQAPNQAGMQPAAAPRYVQPPLRMARAGRSSLLPPPHLGRGPLASSSPASSSGASSSCRASGP
eukprot:TRINITY_DN82806_c0_g1_i1.p1 TRINITY_DN82806_c0_g1~~TRINITY_DN82806_c0_g1_i1.p1  ORF type:complete len:380 (-),score=54.81 TRINITY_DN82806_c0_g1_i1:117-1256(-)